MKKIVGIVLAAVALFFWASLGDHVWFFHPLPHVLHTLLYDIVAWAIAATVLAWAFAEPRPGTQPSSADTPPPTPIRS